MRRGCRERYAGLVVALALLLGSAFAASAQSLERQSFDEALEKFAADTYNDTDAAIAGVAGSGNPLATQIIEALQDGRLLFSAADKKVYLRAATGGILDASTGTPIAGTEPADLNPVRVNNRIRRSIEAALGGLTLLSPDPARRLEAAKAVFKSRDANALPTLETAINKEVEPRVKRALEEARAAIVVGKPDAKEADRVAAILLLRDRGDQEARGVLAGVQSGQSTSLQKALADAITTIDNRLAAWSVAQNFWYGISLGSVLLLAALVGMAIERGVIRFLYGRPLETLLATWGISLILQQGVRTSFGPTNREVGAPNFMSGAFELGGLTITWNRLWIIVFAGIIFAGLLAALRYTELGLQMRAVTQNRRMAGSMAINTGKIDALTFALGSGIAGLAGVALSQIDNVSPNLGQGYIIDSFLVVVFGGVGNLWGTLVGAMSLGVANKFLEPYAGAVLGKIVLLVIVILFIQKRPRGLFALKGRAVET